MEKVSEKQGSSAVDISIAIADAFFRHCTRAAAARQAQHCHSTFPRPSSRDLNLHYRWRAQHHKRSQSQFDAYKAANSTARTSQQSTGEMIHMGLSSENKSKVRLLPTEHCSWNNQARSQMRWRQLVLWVWWWISWWHKHHKQEELPTSFTDRFGTDKKTSKKEVIAPLPSPRRKLCLGNEDGNTENIYFIFQKRLDFQASWLSCFSSTMQQMLRKCTFAISSWASCSSKPYKTEHLVTNQCPHSSAPSTKQSRGGHLIFSLPLLISI